MYGLLKDQLPPAGRSSIPALRCPIAPLLAAFIGKAKMMSLPRLLESLFISTDANSAH